MFEGFKVCVGEGGIEARAFHNVIVYVWLGLQKLHHFAVRCSGVVAVRGPVATAVAIVLAVRALVATGTAHGITGALGEVAEGRGRGGMVWRLAVTCTRAEVARCRRVATLLAVSVDHASNLLAEAA